MNELAYLAFLLIGVLLGVWLQNPILADRERAVRQKLRRAKVMLAQAAVNMQIADGQLRLVQAVRQQTDEMLAFASREPEPPAWALGRERSPIFDSMTGWLRSTAAMPVLEPSDEPAEPVEPARELAEVAS